MQANASIPRFAGRVLAVIFMVAAVSKLLIPAQTVDLLNETLHMEYTLAVVGFVLICTIELSIAIFLWLNPLGILQHAAAVTGGTGTCECTVVQSDGVTATVTIDCPASSKKSGCYCKPITDSSGNIIGVKASCTPFPS